MIVNKILETKEIKLVRDILPIGETALANDKIYHCVKLLDDKIENWRGDTIQIDENEKDTLIYCIIIFRLIMREKKTVLLHRYKISFLDVDYVRCHEYVKAIASAPDFMQQLEALEKKLRAKSKKEPRKIYYISDCHYYDKAVNDIMDKRGFNNVQAMNDHMIRQWNSRVTERDIVYILGDFSVGGGRETSEILRSLAGEKHLLEGNHEAYLKDKRFDRNHLSSISPYLEIKDAGRHVILCHYPLLFYRGQYQVDDEGIPTTYMLYGHVHNTHDENRVNMFINETRNVTVESIRNGNSYQIPCNLINCFCVFSDYVPLTLDEWVEVDQRRRIAITRSEESTVRIL